MTDYQSFLAQKAITAAPVGFDVADSALNDRLFVWQKAIVRWALRRGRAAIFSRYGTGKTAMQLEWAHQVSEHTGHAVLILAPLAVAQQTKREGEKFGIEVNICRKQADVQDGVNVTNYEMLEHFNLSLFGAIVLDESSILKAMDGKTSTGIIEAVQDIPYRLACTATPAPNDHMELGMHSAYLGIMTRAEMLSMFFVHDGGNTSQWRLKGHAEKDFWQWLCSWAVMLRKPSDIGYDDTGYDLPPLTMHQIEVAVEHQEQASAGAQLYLFPVEALSLIDRRNARKVSMEDRVKAAADLVNADTDQWLVWCNLNAESEALTKSIRGAVQVTGSDTPEHKENAARDFVSGKIRVIVSKPSIYGFGLNFQNCHKAAYVGLSDSFEELDQSVHRIHRFGQTQPCDVYIITSELEGAVVRNIERKRADHQTMTDNMIAHMSDLNTRALHGGAEKETMEYQTAITTGTDWTAHMGDCVEAVAAMADNSIDYSIFSPPFASLYTYSNSNRDMGNSQRTEEFYEHFIFLVNQLYRVMKPGRLLSFHCMNLPSSKTHDGFIGIKDFRGELIRMFVDCGFIYHSEVVIWKDPVTSMQRTKAIGLLHKQLKKDSAMSRQGIPDYLVTMRKPGINPDPVAGPLTYYAGEDVLPEASNDERKSIEIWQRYASPVWFDINPSKTLQYTSAREQADEKHICPLQLEVIERALQLWTNKGDLVLSPFAGIGSEGHESIRLGRRFVGVELKPSYYRQMVANLRRAEMLKDSPTLFDLMEEVDQSSLEVE